MLAVIGALFANGVIAVLKFVGAAITCSSGMMAEALHSVADKTNPIFLLLGLRLRVVELLTMHLAPKQILINAHVQLRPDLRTGEIETSIREIEDRIKSAEPKVEMMFLEVTRNQA